MRRGRPHRTARQGPPTRARPGPPSQPERGFFRTARRRIPLTLACLLTLLATAFCGPLGSYAGQEDEPVQLVFAGDIMLDGLPGEAVARGRDPFTAFADILAAADLAVGNLECVVATVGKKVNKPWTFRAHPRVLPLLDRHFGALSLANNHTGDYGHRAFLQQLELLKQHKVLYFGGGRNVVEARTPLLVERKGLRVALLGYNDFQPREFEAGPSWPGVAWAVDDQILADLKAARSVHKADLVIPYLHWGSEGDPANRRQKRLARLMIENGADVVVGAHPHVTQGAEYYRGKLIVYSLGNFVFDGFKTQETRTGWLLRLTLSRNGLVEWDTVPARIDDQGIPHIARDVSSPFGRAGSRRIGQRTFQQ
jgi:poly-gamma-glutamate capsule biosynthesis protein CapA/YwtB (metallophosphatase superfamily)